MTNNHLDGIIAALQGEYADLKIETYERVSGGDVNQAYALQGKDAKYFLLLQPNQAQDFYEGEAAGLDAFESAGITAPKVIAKGDYEGTAYLLLTYLEEGKGSQEDLGKLVAKMHQTYQADGRFGFSFPYRGSAISFDNAWTDAWYKLFFRRIDALYKAIRTQHLFTEEDEAAFKAVYRIMHETLEAYESKPSLLHGDLWAGNYMFLSDGRPALFDPSPLYGDREFDLGATITFGGFSEAFYRAYHEAYPLDAGYEQRILFYKLYLLLVHLVKFGSSYRASVRQTMQDILSQ